VTRELFDLAQALGVSVDEMLKASPPPANSPAGGDKAAKRKGKK
jgi:hypothetical protein